MPTTPRTQVPTRRDLRSSHRNRQTRPLHRQRAQEPPRQPPWAPLLRLHGPLSRPPGPHPLPLLRVALSHVYGLQLGVLDTQPLQPRSIPTPRRPPHPPPQLLQPGLPLHRTRLTRHRRRPPGRRPRPGPHPHAHTTPGTPPSDPAPAPRQAQQQPATPAPPATAHPPAAPEQQPAQTSADRGSSRAHPIPLPMCSRRARPPGRGAAPATPAAASQGPGAASSPAAPTPPTPPASPAHHPQPPSDRRRQRYTSVRTAADRHSPRQPPP